MKIMYELACTTHPHNVYTILAETGIIFTIIIIFLFITNFVIENFLKEI